MAKKAKTKSKKPKKKGSDAARRDTLRYSTYTIAAFDLISSVFFSAMSIQMLMMNTSWTAFFALLFSIFWTSIIFLLIVGIYLRRPKFIRGWILFSLIGIILEAGLLLYGLFASTSIDSERMKGVGLLFVGLVVESIFVYIVYKLYEEISRCKKPRQRSRCCGCFSKKGKKKQKKKKKKKAKKSKQGDLLCPKPKSKSKKKKKAKSKSKKHSKKKKCY